MTPRDIAAMLGEFFAVFGVQTATLENRADVATLCRRLSTEECLEEAVARHARLVAKPGTAEYDAALTDDIAEKGDVIYVAFYTAHAHGIELDPVFVEDARKRLVYALDIARAHQGVCAALDSMCAARPGSWHYANTRLELTRHLEALVVACCTEIRDLGFDPYEIVEIIHRANMRKVWPDGKVHKDAHGKVRKPLDFIGPLPEIRAIIAAQHTIAELAV